MKNKSIKRLILMSAIFLPIIMFVIPNMYKSRVEDEAKITLERNQMEIVEKYGDYSYIYQQQDYIVRTSQGDIDTIGVCLHKGEVIISSTIDYKKTLPKKMIGL